MRTYFTTRRLCFLAAEIVGALTIKRRRHFTLPDCSRTYLSSSLGLDLGPNFDQPNEKATTCDEDNMHEETSFPPILLESEQQQPEQTFQPGR